LPRYNDIDAHTRKLAEEVAPLECGVLWSPPFQGFIALFIFALKDGLDGLDWLDGLDGLAETFAAR